MGFIAYIYSQPVEGRYLSTFKALTGKIDTRYDSSSRARMLRAQIAIKSIITNPLGTGWGSQGWVHSDALQIAASIGIIPGLIFILSPLLLFFNVFRDYKNPNITHSVFYFVQFNILIFIIISLSLNGNILLVQSGVPLMILWALVEGYRQTLMRFPCKETYFLEHLLAFHWECILVFYFLFLLLNFLK